MSQIKIGRRAETSYTVRGLGRKLFTYNIAATRLNELEGCWRALSVSGTRACCMYLYTCCAIRIYYVWSKTSDP